VAQARENASLNEFGGRCSFVRRMFFAFLKKVRPGQFDLIVLDPPAFAKTKSALADARKAIPT